MLRVNIDQMVIVKNVIVKFIGMKMAKTNFKKTFEMIDSITKSVKRMETGSEKEHDYLLEKFVDLFSELKLYSKPFTEEDIKRIKEAM